MTETPNGPVLIELDEDSAAAPADAPPVPDIGGPEAPEGRAMQTVALMAARRGSGLARWFWGLLAAVVGALISLALWQFVMDLIARNAVLGWAMTALLTALGLVALLIVLREWAAFRRLARVDRLHHEAEAALAAADRNAAQGVARALDRLYAERPALKWQRERLAEQLANEFDADATLALAERTLLAPLDAAARSEVEAAARQVAMVTALVPLAFADVFAALTANMRMIRRIAEIYGGRSGTLGSLRLLRVVFTHLVATGAVAVGDDMLGSFAGGGLLAKLSRRFGEGVVNGALTARVGAAAMEVCRPLPFRAEKRPPVGKMMGGALTGLFPAERESS